MHIVSYLALLAALIQISLSSPIREKTQRTSRKKQKHTSGGDRERLVFCRSNDDCEKSMFCDTHYGLCNMHRLEGEHCREDSHCKDRLFCMLGECRNAPKTGQEGARCENASDCRPGLCCARTESEKVCKPRLSLGEMCYVPKGGIDFVLDEVCPCEEGLVCGSVGQAFFLKSSSIEDYEKLRCRSNPKGHSDETQEIEDLF